MGTLSRQTVFGGTGLPYTQKGQSASVFGMLASLWHLNDLTRFPQLRMLTASVTL